MELFLTSRLLEVPHGFSVRRGGVSEEPFRSLNLGGSVGDLPERVRENQRRLFVSAGLDPASLCWVEQVHGDLVLEVGAQPLSPSRPLGEADGLCSRAPGVTLGIRTADCVPVLLWARDAGAVAAVHAGWKGSRLRIAEKVARHLVQRYGADPADLRAAIGPSIRRCCYEVGEDLAALFEKELGPEVVDRTKARPRLDLVRANQIALEAAGLRPEHIDALPACTHCDAERFFSHRRDHGATGRHLSFVALRGAERSFS